jgi:tetratricopeptide (TPR) repeat protein
MLAAMATNWTPGLVVLGAGVLTTLLVLLLTRKRAEPAAKDDKLADLDQRLHLLLDQLRGLEAERHQLGPAFAGEKSRLEQEAAQVLRARDEHLKARPAAPRAAVTAASPSPAAPAPAAPGLLSPQLKGALVGGGVVLFFVAVGFSLKTWQGERTEDGVMTGRTPPGADVPPAQGAPPVPPSPAFEQALARAKADPRDVEAAAFASHELIRQQAFEDADRLTRQALAVDPFHLESRIHRAVLRATHGEFRPALDELGHLAQTYPDAWEALLFRGALALQIGESQVALDSFVRFQAEAPADEHPPQLGSAITMLRQRLQGR